MLNFMGGNFFRACPFVKPHILFYNNDLAIQHGFPNSILKSTMITSPPFYQGFQAIFPPETAHFILYSSGLATGQYSFPDITHFEVGNCHMSAILNLIELNFFRTYPSLKPHLLYNSNGLVQNLGKNFPVIKHNKVKSGRRSAILNLIKSKSFMIYPYLKRNILFNSNGLTI